MRKNRVILLVLIVVGLSLAWPIQSFFSQLQKPEHEAHLVELDQLAGDFYQLTKKGDLDAARSKLNQLGEIFPNQTLPTRIRIESLNAVTQSILAAKQMYANPASGEDKLLWHATQVRVAIDALSHAHQPMWREYYSSYANQMQNLLQASVERDNVAFLAQFEENYQLFLAIRPAMSVQLQAVQMEKISAAYQLIHKEIRNEQVDWQLVREALRELSAQMQIAFVGEDKSTLAQFIHPQSPLTLILTIAGVVCMTLAYVAWRKYQAEQIGTFG